ncbi:DUF1700 domain-containing protein [Levilactobacillus namurensis]|uniref:DUF1700 domain-containing protein n=1 Tax=Levilactobacillus namurensis TaxID=380393 RepID=UPI00222E4309|nr:DUF1700 domain-containing protein [Levilactobacillus namurensis]MCW3779196.1 DUF1700 domain-containing protein [Levilactobacillus namurensis]MDT7020014.1 DUF1700 domain-containing protein [Levilactobacillus namurensis]WNN65409.1 DUF1700 domain-containing protein [Levilactobacillus namurensis]
MDEYIQALQRLLMQLTTAEQQDVVEYYREYLQDAGITSYQGAVDALGTPQSVARKALADYSIKMNTQADQKSAAAAQKRPGTKDNVRMIWLIILALLSTPVTIPIVLVLGALIVAVGAVILGIVAAGFGLLFAGLASGVVGVVVGIMMLFTAPATGAFYLGLGLVVLGASWLITEGVVWCGIQLIRWLANLSRWVYNRWMPKHPKKRGGQS